MTFYAAPLSGTAKTSQATLRTTTGAGRSDFTYVRDAQSRDRVIDSEHLSSRNADIKLRYHKSGFNGLIEMSAKLFDVHGANVLGDAQDNEPPHGEGLRKRDDTPGSSQWTHYVGSEEGKDRLMVYTRGWAGLYF
jgi:hypothetical protein